MKAVHEENLKLLEEFLLKYGCSELGGKNLKINNRKFDSFYYT